MIENRIPEAVVKAYAQLEYQEDQRFADIFNKHQGRSTRPNSVNTLREIAQNTARVRAICSSEDDAQARQIEFDFTLNRTFRQMSSQRDLPNSLQKLGIDLPDTKEYLEPVATQAVLLFYPDVMARSVNMIKTITCGAVDYGQEIGVRPETVITDPDMYQKVVQRLYTPEQFVRPLLSTGLRFTFENYAKMMSYLLTGVVRAQDGDSHEEDQQLLELYRQIAEVRMLRSLLTDEPISRYLNAQRLCYEQYSQDLLQRMWGIGKPIPPVKSVTLN